MIHMREENFHRLLDEFPVRFGVCKAVAKEMRQLLFPLDENGQIFFGVDSSPEAVNNLYDGFIASFDRAIALERTK